MDEMTNATGTIDEEHCTVCGEPAHASETDDDGRCVDCMRAAGVEPIFPEDAAEIVRAAMDRKRADRERERQLDEMSRVARGADYATSRLR